MKHGDDQDSYFVEKTLARAEVEKMGEPISNPRFKGIRVQVFTAEYKGIKMMMYRDPMFDIDQMQSTMRHLYLDDISRNSDTKIVGRGVAMSVASTCSRCGKQGHFALNCWKRQNSDSQSTRYHDKQIRATILPRARQNTRLHLIKNGTRFTRPPLTAMRDATSKERHSHRRVDALTPPQPY